jgi:hypothetical protein
VRVCVREPSGRTVGGAVYACDVQTVQRRADAVRIGDRILDATGREFRVVSVRLEGVGGGVVSLALAGTGGRAVLAPGALVAVRVGGGEQHRSPFDPIPRRVRPEAGLR